MLHPATVGDVVRWSALSRLVVISLSVFAAHFLPIYDSSARIPLYIQAQSQPVSQSHSSCRSVVPRALAHLGHWDGVYFTHIAAGGFNSTQSEPSQHVDLLNFIGLNYPYEQFHAFFPGFPWLARCAGLAMQSLFDRIDYWSGTLSVEWATLGGILVSNVAFVLAARELFLLSHWVFGGSLARADSRGKGAEKETEAADRMASLSALLFCLTPAGIFHSAVYTESVFAWLTFAGIRALAEGESRGGATARWKGLGTAVAAFTAAACVRSNAILYGGFFFARFVFWFSPTSDGAGDRRSRRRRTSATKTSATSALTLAWQPVALLKFTVTALVGSVVVALPYIVFQWIGYHRFCGQESLSPRPWCDHSRWAVPVPSMYGFVQAEYWNQGFLRFWELKQLPNSALGSPMIVLSTYGVVSCLKGLPRLVLAQTRGSFRSSVLRVDADILVSIRSIRAFPVVVYWAMMLLLVVTSFHVHTITRFFSSIPAVFWFAAELAQRSRPWALFVLSYFLCFNVVGIVLFSTYLPWS